MTSNGNGDGDSDDKAHLINTGTDLHIPDNHNDASGDSNPYAYPYFRVATTNHCKMTIYDLVVRFDALWRDYTGENNELVEGLISQIQEKVRYAPNEVLWKDSCGDTALHRLAQGARFPVSNDPEVLAKTTYLVQVAEALILEVPSITTSQNNWKETPLHQFSQHCGFPSEFASIPSQGMTISTMEENPMMAFFLLLSRHGAAAVANIWQSVALHDACELQGVVLSAQWNDHPLLEWMHDQQFHMIQHLVLANPDALTTRDVSYNLPLHRCGLSMKCGSNVLQLLLDHLLRGNKDQGDILSHDDAVGHIARMAGRSVPCLYYKAFSNRLPTNMEDMLETHNQDAAEVAMLLGSIWEKLLVFVKADCLGTLDPSVHISLTHAAIRLKIPYCAVLLAVHLYPHELLQLDSQGRTPLVLALETKLEQHYGQPLIEMLIRKEPKATCIPNRHGRLPLHLALSQSMTWDVGVRSVFANAPSAVSARDPQTKLYPFMMAAMNTNDDGDLGTAFELLRSDPAVIHFCSHPITHEEPNVLHENFKHIMKLQ